jgi:hypothetical protein
MSKSSVLAVSLSITLAAMGSARAADERSSFTDRVQQSQGSQGVARTEQVTRTEPEVAGEATSFIARVMASQGLRSTLEAGASAPANQDEATSFINRVVASQRPAADMEEGAASGQPTR